jgi:FMN reductase
MDVEQGRLNGLMAKQLVLAISSPSPTSRTARVADDVLGRIADPDVSVSRTLTAIEQAGGIVIATPIFKLGAAEGCS